MLRGKCRSATRFPPARSFRPRLTADGDCTAGAVRSLRRLRVRRRSSPNPASCVDCPAVASARGSASATGAFSARARLQLNLGNGDLRGRQLNRAPARLEVAARVHAENVGTVRKLAQRVLAVAVGRGRGRRPANHRNHRAYDRAHCCRRAPGLRCCLPGNCCGRSGDPSREPARTQLEAPSTNAAIAAAGIHRIIIPRSTPARRPAPSTATQ